MRKILSLLKPSSALTSGSRVGWCLDFLWFRVYTRSVVASLSRFYFLGGGGGEKGGGGLCFLGTDALLWVSRFKSILSSYDTLITEAQSPETSQTLNPKP